MRNPLYSDHFPLELVFPKPIFIFSLFSFVRKYRQKKRKSTIEIALWKHGPRGKNLKPSTNYQCRKRCQNLFGIIRSISHIETGINKLIGGKIALALLKIIEVIKKIHSKKLISCLIVWKMLKVQKWHQKD